MTPCINWTKGLSHNGYGLTSIGNKTYRAHRVAYCQHNKVTHDSIKGMIVRHKCDNPKCVNPDHLELGTHADNMLDMRMRGRAATSLRNAACKLTPEQVKYIREVYVPKSRTHGTVALASKFGVDDSTIGRAIRGVYHKGITAAEQGG